MKATPSDPSVCRCGHLPEWHEDAGCVFDYEGGGLRTWACGCDVFTPSDPFRSE